MKKNNFKYLHILAAIGFLTLSAGFLCTCEIGLGSAVDTASPEGTLDFPLVDTVIRDSFLVCGTWSDDTNLTDITVQLDNTEYSKSYGPYKAKIVNKSVGKGTFSCVIYPEKYQIVDGTYEVTVSLKDDGEHTTKIFRQFVIDNTAPLVVLQRPNSIATDSDADTDEYGQHFSLEGSICDDNNVDHIDVSVYSDAECSDSNFIKTIRVDNVEAQLSTDVAVFEEGKENSYSEIYDNKTQASGDITRYCKITTYDKAQKYPIDGSEQTEEDKMGNASSIYYLYEDVKTNILEKYNINTITELYKMKNGLYGISGSNRSANDSVDNILKTLDDNKNEKGKFILNPSINPYFTVSGKTAYEGNSYSIAQEITSGSTVVIDINQGRDNKTLIKDTLRPYLLRCDVNGSNAPEDVEENRIYFDTDDDRISPEKKGKAYRFTINLTSGLKSSNGTYSLEPGDYYKFGVEGQDANVNEKDGKVVSNGTYAFLFKSSYVYNSIDVKTSLDGENWTSDSVIYAKENSTIYIKGLASIVKESSASGSVDIASKISINFNGNSITATADAKDRTEEGGYYKQNYTASYNIGNSLTNDKNYTLKVSVGEKSTDKSVIIRYDNEKPVVEIGNPSPTGKIYSESSSDATEYLNGKNVSLVIRNSDNNSMTSSDSNKNSLVGTVIEFQQKTDESDDNSWSAVSDLTVKETKNLSNLVLKDIDTTKLTDEKDVRIVVRTSDIVGNVTEEISPVYKVKQASDKPQALPGDSSATLTYSEASVFDVSSNDKNTRSPGSAFSFILYDDDGLASAKLSMYGSDGKTVIASGSLSDDDKNKTTANLSIQIPSSVSGGVYKFTLELADFTDQTNSYTFYGKITSTAPVVQASSDVTKITTNTSDVVNPVTKIPVNIKIESNESPFKIERKVNSYPAGDTYTLVSSSVSDSTYTDTVEITKSILGLKESDTVKSGSYTMLYKITDKNGLYASTTVKFSIDNEKPVNPVISSYPDTAATAALTGMFSGTAGESDKESYQSGVSKIQYRIGDSGTIGAAV